MSDARTSRLPLIALGCAVLAVLVAGAAAVHVLTRPASPPSARESASPAELRVAARDVYKLVDGVDVVVEAGQPRGIRPKDASLARTLGLADDDVIASLSGRITLRERDVTDVITRISMLDVRSIFAELERGDGSRRIVRWMLDGDLFAARRDAQLSSAPPPAGIVPRSGNPMDSIEKLDATHYRIARALYNDVLASPVPYLAGAKITPDRTRGFVLQAVRPDSLFARLGAMSGDTIVAFNREPVVDIDDVGSWFNNAKRGTSLTIDLVRSGGTPVTIHIAIR